MDFLADHAKEAPEEEKPLLAFRLKRLVLRTEDILTQELRHWYLIMKP